MLQNKLLLAAVLLITGVSARADSLWLGNDSGPAVPAYHVSTTGAILGSFTQGTTGFAFDGALVYSSDPFGGAITRRLNDANGTFVSSFSVAGGALTEDMAWDSTRNRLWRTDHQGNVMRIDPVAGTSDAFHPLPTTDPGGLLTPMGAIGLAYDPSRDLLYISFCQTGCTKTGGVVFEMNPNTGALGNELFRIGPGIIGGLAYESATDTLWMGTGFDGNPHQVRHVQRDGTLISSFNTPGFFADGLELIPSENPVPEPSFYTLIALGLVAILTARRRLTAE
jgi:PEP-CTERM motif-containing protein